jgi:hypothetical protein
VGLPFLALRLDRLRHRGQVEQHRGQVHPRYPVDHGVMGLADQREAVVLEALHEPGLPQRLGAVQPLGENPRRHRQQLLLVAWLGQRRVADVVLEVEVGVVRPHRASALQRRHGQLLAVAGDEVKAAPDVVEQVDQRRWRPLEHRDPTHVHVRAGTLVVEEGRVDCGEPVEVVLRHPP